MSLENLHCPQFVDFSVQETFDLNDGADFFFEKGVVGELGMEMDLGTFNSNPNSNTAKNDEIQEITEKMTNLTNLSNKPQPSNLKEKSPMLKAQENKPGPRRSLRDKNPPSSYGDKENVLKTPKPPTKMDTKPIKEIAPNSLDSAISSAMDMILSSNSTKGASTNSTPKATADIDHGTPPAPEALRENSTRNSNELDAGKSSTPVYTEIEKSSQDANLETSNLTPEAPTIINNISGTAAKSAAPSLNKQKPPMLTTTTNPSIVKKTLAKMTAAFKQNKPIVVQNPDNHKNKRMDYPKSKVGSGPETRSGRGSQNSSINGTPRSRAVNTSQGNDSKLRPNDSRLEKPMSPESSNRRCSSVPRTLRERQALNNNRINANKATKHNTFGEKIHNFFNNNNKSKQQQQRLKGPAVKNIEKISSDELKDRRRSRSVNESINTSKPAANSTNPNLSKQPNHVRRSSHNQNDSLNQNKGQANKSSYTKITASPSFSKPRQKSAERTPLLPHGVTSLYQGVKFVPNSGNQINIKKKYNENYLPAFSLQSHASGTSSVLTNTLSSVPIDEILKSRPACLQKTKPLALNTNVKKAPVVPTRTTPGKSASFRNNPSKPLAKTYSKTNVSDQALNVSSDKAQLNTSEMNSTRIRKQSESNCSINNPSGIMHSELRALKRQEYNQSLKEKEKMASILKQEMETEKLKKQREEIQKIRIQRNFRSNPIKHYKAVEIKPSVKHLTEPSSPKLSTSTIRLNDISRNNDSCNFSSSHRLSMALVDAPLENKKSKCPSSNKNTLGRFGNQSYTSKQRTLSQSDIRF